MKLFAQISRRWPLYLLTSLILLLFVYTIFGERGAIHLWRLRGETITQVFERLGLAQAPRAAGHIINVASAAAFAPSKALVAYSTSKAAVLMLSECLRAELQPRGHPETMKTVVPMFTWLKSHSASLMCMRMQPCEAE